MPISYQKEPWYSLGIHYFSINNYSIFYIIKEVDGKLEARVTRVTNGRRDTDQVLNEMKLDEASKITFTYILFSNCFKMIPSLCSL